MLLCDLLGICRLLVERLAPTADMAVAPFDAAERRLVEGLNGFAVAFFEDDRYQHLEPCRGTVILPIESEREPPVRDNLAIDAGKPILTVIRGLDHPAIATADA